MLTKVPDGQIPKRVLTIKNENIKHCLYKQSRQAGIVVRPSS